MRRLGWAHAGRALYKGKAAWPVTSRHILNCYYSVIGKGGLAGIRRATKVGAEADRAGGRGVEELTALVGWCHFFSLAMHNRYGSKKKKRLDSGVGFKSEGEQLGAEEEQR